MIRNIRMKIAYDGTDFAGWQRQPDQITVQGEIEKVLTTLCKEKILINGSGRTDAGVHAFGQEVNFAGDFSIPTEKIGFAANNLLPESIRILSVEVAPCGFHARFNAVGKKYAYYIDNTRDKDPFMRNRVYYVSKPLDIQAMIEAGKAIVGTHDFKCFEGAGANPRESTVRTVTSLDIIQEDSEIVIEITGDGFLYKMVRNITGTLVDIGTGKIGPDEMAKIIESKDRTMAGHTAPPQGLYLVEVYYE